MANASCANCNTANTNSHPLKLCGDCKLVNESISVPHGPYLLKNMRPVSELPLGYQKMIAFQPEWLASISHLSAGEHGKAKTEWANQMEAMIEASMTPESREA